LTIGKRGGGKSKGGRPLTERVKSARGRTSSSTRWLQRQLNDPYVEGAKREGWRSRAAFKLVQLDERYHFLKRGARVVDLGAAPGGWTQVAVARAGSGHVIAVDLTEMEPVDGATILTMDATGAEAIAAIRAALDGPADVVLSDMAAPATGHRQTDHLRIMGLVEEALSVAEKLLRPGGVFVAKVLQGGTEDELLAHIKRRFARVSHAKPEASRKDSREIYLVAEGFRSENDPNHGQT
jgi:23S rRNA (uridine2552-2'-O)-methyltransferase